MPLVRVREVTRERLKKRRLVRTESMDSVIKRLLNATEPKSNK